MHVYTRVHHKHCVHVYKLNNSVYKHGGKDKVRC